MPREHDDLYEAGGMLDAAHQADDARSEQLSGSSNPEVCVTGMHESDYGTELRVEFRMPGKPTLELVVVDGVSGFKANLMRHGADSARPYAGHVSLFDGEVPT